MRDGGESSLTPEGEGDEGGPEKTATRQVSGQEREGGGEREENLEPEEGRPRI